MKLLPPEIQEAEFLCYRNRLNSRQLNLLSLINFLAMSAFIIQHTLFPKTPPGSARYTFYHSVYFSMLAICFSYMAYYRVHIAEICLHKFRIINFTFYSLILSIFMLLSAIDFTYKGDAFTFSIAVIVFNVLYKEEKRLLVATTALLTGILIFVFLFFAQEHPRLIITILKILLYSIISIILAIVQNRSFKSSYIARRLSEINSAELKKANLTMARDLQMAINTQHAFILQAAPEIFGWDAALFTKACAGVSGDFHDFYTEAEQLKGVALFDVSGHGIAPALLTLHAKSIIFHYFTSGKASTLSRIMKKINSRLIQELADSYFYLTGILMRIQGNKVEYINAGHPDIIINTKKNGASMQFQNPEDEVRNCILGIDFNFSDWRSVAFEIESGDTLFLFTDGIYEGFSREENRARKLRQQLLDTIQSLPSATTAEEYKERLISKVKETTEDGSFSDDITLIVLKKL